MVYQRFTPEKKINDIALDLNMSKSVVERVLHMWTTTGEVVSSGQGRKGKRKKVLTAQEIEVSYSSLYDGASKTNLFISAIVLVFAFTTVP